MANPLKSDSNPWFGVSMVLVGVIVGYTAALGTTGLRTTNKAAMTDPAPAAVPVAPSAAAPSAPAMKDVVAPDPASDHVRGSTDATISLIEYSDYECPFCKRHHPTLKQALTEFGGDVNWVYRHYPLAFHPHAEPTAVAAECVAELGGNDAFWAFTDKIFETQGAWAYEAYVGELGLDVSKFTDCIESGTYVQRVRDDLNEGTASGVRGTPGTIVFNNETKQFRYVSGAQPYASIKAAIESLL